MEREKASHDLRRMSRLSLVSPRAATTLGGLGRNVRARRRTHDCARSSPPFTSARAANYGVPRILDELRYDHQVRCSGKRVLRLMRQLGIKGTHRRRHRKTTERDAALAVAPDLMNRDFTATKPDEKYVGDITYIRTWEGWLYLATSSTSSLAELSGGPWAPRFTPSSWSRLSRWRSVDARPRAPSLTPIRAAYTSLTYGRRIREAGLVQSMGSRGDCFDNAMAESFFATLECELLAKQSFENRAHARMEVFDFIEGYYTVHRRHSGLTMPGSGMLSPAKFEIQWLLAQEAERVTQ